MTATFDPETRKGHKPDANRPKPRANWRQEEEPWPIWAALMVFLNILVISAMTWGLPGLVAVMVGAAIFMVVMLVLIVFG